MRHDAGTEQVDGLLLAEKINRNDSVNSSDWVEFAGQWLWED